MEIHRALNEWAVSEETSAVLSRVSRALGEREGTGPDDDPLPREQRAATIFKMIRALLRERGVAAAADFPAGLGRRHVEALRSVSDEQARACRSGGR